MAKRGRKSFRTDAQRQLVREISSLGTRLTKRLANVESKGLSNMWTEQARSINLSVKGLNYRELQSKKREITRALKQRSTSVRGARELESAWDSIEGTINIKSKATRHRVYENLNKAYEIYPIFRNKRYRYTMREFINQQVNSRKKNKTILRNLNELAESLSTGGDEAFERKRLTLLK